MILLLDAISKFALHVEAAQIHFVHFKRAKANFKLAISKYQQFKIGTQIIKSAKNASNQFIYFLFEEPMTKWLSKPELNSVGYLSGMRKAIYLMKSISHPGEYRFGGIGAVQGQANTPIRRLGQSTHVKKARVKTLWVYIAMIELNENTSAGKVRDLERLVRNYLFGSPGHYKNRRESKKDYLKNIEDERALIKAFRKALDGLF